MQLVWAWVLVISLTSQLHTTMPHAQATWDYLKWSDDTYGPSNNPHNLQANLLVQPINAPPTPQAHVLQQWIARRGLHTTAGVFRNYSQAQLGSQPGTVVRGVLAEIHNVLQPPLQMAWASATQGSDKWRIFSDGKFLWTRAHGVVHTDLCICYKKSLAHATPYFTPKATGYLDMFVGLDAQGRPIKEYAHRLVCMAYHGGPRLPNVAAYDWEMVVSHLCNNSCCLNPRHMQWMTLTNNFNYGRGHVGIVPNG